MTWHSIESVPTDTPILLSDGECVVGGVKCEKGCMHSQCKDGYPLMNGANYMTHWMEMPKPPRKK